MSHSELGPTLLAALHGKLIADMNLLRLQQDMHDAKRAYSASAMLSALEDCDDALENVWREVRQTLQKHAIAEAQPTPITQHVSAQAGVMIAPSQENVRQLFARPPAVSPPLHSSSR